MPTVKLEDPSNLAGVSFGSGPDGMGVPGVPATVPRNLGSEDSEDVPDCACGEGGGGGVEGWRGFGYAIRIERQHPRRINIRHRLIPNVAVDVPALRLFKVLIPCRVRTTEPVVLRCVEARLHVDQTRGISLLVVGEALAVVNDPRWSSVSPKAGTSAFQESLQSHQNIEGTSQMITLDRVDPLGIYLGDFLVAEVEDIP